jgi:hypothetical protein
MTMISDIARKQLERVSEQEGVQILVLYEQDSALIFRDEPKQIETLIPDNQLQGGPLSHGAYHVLLIMTFLHDKDLMNQARALLEAKRQASEEQTKRDPPS